MLLKRTRNTLLPHVRAKHPLRGDIKLNRSCAKKMARRIAKDYRNLVVSPGRILAPGYRSLRLSYRHLARHAFIAGGSGNGKSRLIYLVLVQMALEGFGFTLIDPHGDLANLLRDALIRFGIGADRVVYLQPGREQCFSMDPVADMPTGLSKPEYEQELTRVVDTVVQSILRNVSAADQEVMNRLKRWLKNVLVACLVRLDENNTHVGLDKALAFTNPDRADFSALYERVRDHLPVEVRADFEMLIDTNRPRDREAWLESTVNRLRELLSPMVKLIYGQHSEPFRFANAVANSKIVLINLAEGTISRQQGNMIGGQLISQLLNTVRAVPLAKRVPHLLVIDEAENYIGEDLRMGFAELRKFLLSTLIIVQDLSCLEKGELDLSSKVVSQCLLQMTFQQQEPDDVEYLAKSFGYGSLDMTPLFSERLVHDGYDWVDTRSISVSAGMSRSMSMSQSQTTTTTQSTQESVSESIQRQISESVSESESDGHSEQRSRSQSTGESLAVSAGTSKGVTLGKTRSISRGVAMSSTFGKSATESSSDTRTETKNETHQDSLSNSTSASETESEGDGSSVGESSSLSPFRVTSNESRSRSRQRGEARGNSVGFASSDSVSRGFSFGMTDGWAESRNESSGTTSSLGTVTGTSKGRSRTFTQGINVGVSKNTSDGTSQGTSHSTSHGVSRGISVGRGLTFGRSIGTAHGTSVGITDGVSEGITNGVSVTYSKTPLARYKLVRDRTGQLVESVADQFARIANLLASLPDRTVLVKCKGMGSPFLLRVHDVPDVPSDAEAVAEFMRDMHAAHACFFDPRTVQANVVRPVAKPLIRDVDSPIA